MLIVVVAVDVVEVDLGMADGVPGIPGDRQDHQRDRKTDDRVGDLHTERNGGRARNNPERYETVDPGVVAVGDHAALARRRPAESRTCAASSLPTKPIIPAAASTQRWLRCCGWMKRKIVS